MDLKILNNIQCWEGCGTIRIRTYWGGECKIIQPIWKTVSAVSLWGGPTLGTWTFLGQGLNLCHSRDSAGSLTCGSTRGNHMCQPVLPRSLPKGYESICTCRDLHVNVQGRFSCNWPKLEKAQMSIKGKWRNCGKSDHGILCSNKKG